MPNASLNHPATRPRSLGGAIAGARCPRCRQGAMFAAPAYHLARFADMHTHCPHCQLRFEVEPGFFYGAMYVSYAFGIATFVAGLVAVNVLVAKPTLSHYLWVIIPALVLLAPLSFRYSRVLMLYGFGGVKFNPNA
jgi:uncharacterized protein (DUF983 family)